MMEGWNVEPCNLGRIAKPAISHDPRHATLHQTRHQKSSQPMLPEHPCGYL